MLLFSTVLDTDSRLTKEEFIRLIREWNSGSPHADGIIRGLRWNGERRIRQGDGRVWLEIRDHGDVTAVRYESRESGGAVWDTDFVMDFGRMKMSVCLYRSYAAGTASAAAPDSRFSIPYFISLLIRQGYLRDDCGLPVTDVPMVIGRKSVSLLADIVSGKARYRLPVVYVSKTKGNRDPVNTAYLASRLKGTAHVLTESEKPLDREIRSRCRGKNEYDGAIGVYYPGDRRRHTRYLYTKEGGYDAQLMEKTVQDIFRYWNVQEADVTLTWQGVTDAMLAEDMDVKQKKLRDAEAAEKEAKAETMRVKGALEEKEKAFRKKALEDAKLEAGTILDGFEEDMQKLKEQVDALTRENEALKGENHGMKMKLESRTEVPILYMGKESDFYPGEIKDLILDTLSDAEKHLKPRSRRSDVVRDIINNNDFRKLTVEKAEELKRIMKNYDGMSVKTRSSLNSLGFEIEEDGKHYKVTYYGDGRYQTSYSKTPSDGRSGKNSAQNTVNMAF